MMLDVGLVRSFLEGNRRIAISLNTRQNETPTAFHGGAWTIEGVVLDRVSDERAAAPSCVTMAGAEQGSVPRCHRS